MKFNGKTLRANSQAKHASVSLSVSSFHLVRLFRSPLEKSGSATPLGPPFSPLFSVEKREVIFISFSLAGCHFLPLFSQVLLARPQRRQQQQPGLGGPAAAAAAARRRRQETELPQDRFDHARQRALIHGVSGLLQVLQVNMHNLALIRILICVNRNLPHV